MLASDSSPVLRTKPPVPVPAFRNPKGLRFISGDCACFDPRSRSRPSLAVGQKLSVNLIKMKALRRMGGGCFKNHRQDQKALKVEADSGGEDLFDASATVAKPLPEHLVIMVNGIVGR